MRGEIAEEFNFLVKNMWCGEYRSISPRDFKVRLLLPREGREGEGREGGRGSGTGF